MTEIDYRIQPASSYGICAVILLFSLAAAYPPVCRLISQIYCCKAESLFQKAEYEQGAKQLETAAYYQPNDEEIQKESGNAYLKLSEFCPQAEDSFRLLQRSKACYLRAEQLQPRDAETLYALAKAESRLEFLFLYLHGEAKENPYQPLPYFKEAVRLRPNGIEFHYALARYLYRKKNEADLLAVIRKLAGMYPPVYYYLKNEAFWSDKVRTASEQGLGDAVRENVLPREAYTAMSLLKAEGGDMASAISSYEAAIVFKAFENHSGTYLHLGRLYLKNGQAEEAEKHFFQALKLSGAKDKDIGQIYAVYKDEKASEKFYPFYRQARQRFALSYRTEILAARSLTDLKQYREAREILTELNRSNDDPEAYYWLACIAEAEKDWERMDLAIHKAAMLDPKNSQYHLKFSEVLARLNRWEEAEKEADAAIRYQTKPSPWTFNQRAWIRRQRENYAGAIEDWTSAARLKPDMAVFHSRIEEAYRKLSEK